MKNFYTILALSIVAISMMNKAYGKTEVWACPAASDIKVKEAPPLSHAYTWEACTVSSLKHQILFHGFYNRQFPEKFASVTLIDDGGQEKMMECDYTIKGEEYKGIYGDVRTLGKDALGKGEDDWISLPGKNCHFNSTVDVAIDSMSMTETCNQSIEQCTVTCDI